MAYVLFKPERLGAHHSEGRSVQMVRCTASAYTSSLGGHQPYGPTAVFTYIAAVDLHQLARGERGSLTMSLRSVSYGPPGGVDTQDEAGFEALMESIRQSRRWEKSARSSVASALQGPVQLVEEGLHEIIYMARTHKLTDDEVAGRHRRLAEEYVSAIDTTDLRTPMTPARRASLERYAEIAIHHMHCTLTGVPDPIAAIVERYEVTPSTARSWIHRARKRGLLWIVPKMVGKIKLSPEESAMVEAALHGGHYEQAGEIPEYLQRLDGLAREVEALHNELTERDARRSTATRSEQSPVRNTADPASTPPADRDGPAAE